MRIGYACKVIGVPGTEISGCTLKNITDDRLRAVISQNLSSLERILDYNIKQGLQLFRISSDIIPFGDHPLNKIDWVKEYEEAFCRLGKKIREAEMRVSMHPGQYTVLNSPKQDVVEKSIRDLSYHGRFLEALRLDDTHKIILHIGGVYGDKSSAMERFCHEYQGLSDKIKARLVIENDEKCFNVEEVLQVSNRCGCPVVMDVFHHQLNPPKEQLGTEAWLRVSGETWKVGDGAQKIHYSEQKAGGSKGSHSETICLRKFRTFYDSLCQNGLDIDIMLEVKDKNLSAVKCKNGVSERLPISYLEAEWARYKYFVLSRSQRSYEEIRKLLKDKVSPQTSAFYERIEGALEMGEDIGAEVNAAQHVWGYLRKEANKAEAEGFQKRLNQYIETGHGIALLKKYLLKMAIKQNQPYLLDSLYFYL